MNPDTVEDWLRRHCGLESSSLGPGVVSRAARSRAAALGCASEAEYLDRLAGSAEERQLLVDQVVVPETWFFRDRAALDAVARHAVETWGPAHPGQTFRLLCVPCATGEEPYSLAMAFARAGWPLERLTVEAVDISHGNVDAARAGLYRKNSFRAGDLAFREAYLEPAGADCWRVRDSVRAPVALAEGNLLDGAFAAGRGPYEAIFCRNLLIYFDRAAQDRAIATLAGLLAPGGWIAVGPAEPVLLFAHGFSPLKVPAGFLLHRAPPVSVPAPPASLPRKATRLGQLPPKTPSKPAPAATVEAQARRPEVPDTLATIQGLADAGHLADAARRGTALLAVGATPELLYLLGVVADAAGETARAGEYYRKALYLAPNHGEALAHLAWQAERAGDLRGARALRARAERTLAKSTAG